MANDKITIYGTLTSAFFGSTKFNKDDMYHVSVKIDEANRNVLVEACKEMYKSVPASFIPKWFKEATEYLNFKSKFDIKVITNDKNAEVTTLGKIINEYGNINGSSVGIAVKIAEGAIYPVAIKIYKFATADFTDLFDDELPF